MQKIQFRECLGDSKDFEFLRNIHRITMEGSIIKTFGKWDDDFQLQRLQERYKESSRTLKILMLDGKEIGTINHWKKNFSDGDFYFIENFYISPEFQGTGLGGFILNEHLKNDITRLSVLNGDANRMLFYKKRGFVPYASEELRTYFQWNPPSVSIVINELASVVEARVMKKSENLVLSGVHS